MPPVITTRQPQQIQTEPVTELNIDDQLLESSLTQEINKLTQIVSVRLNDIRLLEIHNRHDAYILNCLKSSLNNIYC